MTVLPAVTVDFVINRGGPIEISTGGSFQQVSPTHLFGPQTRPMQVRIWGTTDLWILRLRPWLAGDILAMPPEALTNQVIDLEDLLPESHLDLLLASPPRWLEQILRGNPRTRSCRQLERVLSDWLLASREMRVRDFADGIGLSRRHWQRVVRKAVGYGPKKLAAISRVQNAIGLVRRCSKTTAALQAGYYDQAHLCRDLQRYTGRTPSEIAGFSGTLLHDSFGLGGSKSQICKTAYL